MKVYTIVTIFGRFVCPEISVDEFGEYHLDSLECSSAPTLIYREKEDAIRMYKLILSLTERLDGSRARIVGVDSFTMQFMSAVSGIVFDAFKDKVSTKDGFKWHKIEFHESASELVGRARVYLKGIASWEEMGNGSIACVIHDDKAGAVLGMWHRILSEGEID